MILFKSNSKFIFELYNLSKKIKIPINCDNKIFFDKNTNSVFFYKIQLKTTWNSIINKINKNIFIFENAFFNKIKFKGKGFRVRFKKNNKILKFTFGHSHMNCVFVNTKTYKVKRLGKYKYTFRCKNLTNINIFLKKICKIKPINMYTKRGIRLGKQIIYKRKGKKSTYV